MTKTPSPLVAARNYLSYQPRSIAEVQKHLRGKGYTALDIASTLTQLQTERVLDDDNFAELLIHHYQRHPIGRNLLRKKMAQRGLSSTTIAAALARYFTEVVEEEQCRALAVQKLKTLQALPLQKQMARLGGFLSQRGYGESLVWQVLEENGLSRSSNQ